MTNKELLSNCDAFLSWRPTGEELVKFILADRKRVVEPLVRCKQWYKEHARGMEWQSIAAAFLAFQEEALNNAGLED